MIELVGCSVSPTVCSRAVLEEQLGGLLPSILTTAARDLVVIRDSWISFLAIC